MTILYFLWCDRWRYFKANLHKEITQSFEELWCNAILQFLSICLLLQILFFNQNLSKRRESLALFKTNNHKELVHGKFCCKPLLKYLTQWNVTHELGFKFVSQLLFKYVFGNVLAIVHRKHSSASLEDELFQLSF